MNSHFEHVLRSFKGVQKRGANWMALCPAHQDRTPSLSIKMSDDGRVLLKCFADCGVQAILAAGGLTFKHLFPESRSAARNPPSGITVKALAEYKGIPEQFLRDLGLQESGSAVRIPYLHVAGNLVRNRLRQSLNSKLSSWEGSGKALCLYGLWRLPEIARKRYVIFVEGESDAWTLWRFNFPALGFPGASTHSLIALAHLAGVERVYIVYEPDAGGVSFSFGARKRLEDLGFEGNIFEIRLPDGIKDTSQLFLASSLTFVRRFRECLEASVCIRPRQLTAPEWEAPLAFDEIDLPAFPLRVLPPKLSQFVEAVAEATQTPADLAAMLMLAMLGAASAKKFVVTIQEGYLEPTNLFVLVVLPPANRKSAVFRYVTEPLSAFEQREAARLAPIVAAERESARIEEETLKKVREQASKAEGPEKQDLIEKAKSLAEKIAACKPPSLPRLIVEDCTPERLATLLKEQGWPNRFIEPRG